MSRPALVVFDMIGTTVQASERIPEAFTRAFEKEGIRLSGIDVNSVRGKSKRAAIQELLAIHGGKDLATSRSDDVYRTFKRFLLDCYRNESVHAIDGAVSTFSSCHEHGIKVALTTGFDRELAALLVQKLGWLDTIDTLVCNDDVAAGRPAPDLILAAMRRLDCTDVTRVASVGDTVSDLEAGANAGTGWNIGVLSGAHSREQLAAAPHTALIDTVADMEL